MKKILSASQMTKADNFTTETLKLPGPVLMERAALNVCDVISELFDEETKVSVICGSGNNGGDGMAIARILSIWGYPVKYILYGDENKLSETAALQYDILKAMDILPQDSFLEVLDCDLLVDAIFGTGLSRNLNDETIRLIDRLNDLSCFKLAVDIPTGLNATTGEIMGAALKCDITVTFGFEKMGHYLFHGREYCGRLICTEIGITDKGIADETPVLALEEEDVTNLLPKRSLDSHKGTYGKVLVIAGSAGMAGAAYLASKAAISTGAGLVKIYTEEECRTSLQSLLPEAMVVSYSGKFHKTELKKELKWASTVLIGPGMGVDASKKELLKYVFENFTDPIVCDADALYILGKAPDLLKSLKAPCIITPHIGEMSGLTGEQVFDILKDQLKFAMNYSVKHGVCTVLKSASTVCSSPEGSAYLNTYGNNGMSTGGSGDVLSGIIAGLLAQKCDVSLAARLGVLIHALAGDAAKEEVGAFSMTADDIILGLINCLKKWSN